MPAGWTVAAVLAHVAVWDHRVQLLFDRRQTHHVPPGALSEDFDWINDAAKPRQLAPRQAAALAVTSGAEHRNEHLDEIEYVLRRRRGVGGGGRN